MFSVCSGHITISVAKNNKPSKIVGVDIDKKLIDIARKNVRYYMDTQWVFFFVQPRPGLEFFNIGSKIKRNF